MSNYVSDVQKLNVEKISTKEQNHFTNDKPE